MTRQLRENDGIVMLKMTGPSTAGRRRPDGRRGASWRDIPRTIWVLGFVSLFTDLSSEIVHSLLPVFLAGTLGASALTIGVIEGVAESAALIVRIFSGAISDVIGRRKTLILAGYGLAAFTKPLFPLATSAKMVMAARLLDRIGKGIRAAPRDALVADLAPPAVRGAAFGLRQSMDTVGAFAGPALAMLLMAWLHDDISRVLWFAVLPGFVAVGLIVTRVSEPPHAAAPRRMRSPLQPGALRHFSAAYWWVVAIGGVFTLARFSDAFLVLRALQAGLPLTWVPLVMVVMSLFYAVSAYPAGAWSDRVSRRVMLGIGVVLLLAADLVLARADSVAWVLPGAALWGLHMGFSQGVLAAMVADTTPPELKGTAFGVFNLVSGLLTLLANGVAGGLWQTYGAAATFYAGALFAAATILLMARRFDARAGAAR
jgi:MFS family permease